MRVTITISLGNYTILSIWDDIFHLIPFHEKLSTYDLIKEKQAFNFRLQKIQTWTISNEPKEYFSP